MDPELNKKLEEIYRITEENNKMIRKMKRALNWSHVFRIIYWLFILGAAFGAYYFVQPYVEQIGGVYDETKGSIEGIGSFFNLF